MPLHRGQMGCHPEFIRQVEPPAVSVAIIDAADWRRTFRRGTQLTSHALLRHRERSGFRSSLLTELAMLSALRIYPVIRIIH